MEGFNRLVALLMAIAGYAKDIHYTASGDGFYSKHELADRIYSGIDDQIDSIKEVCLLGNDVLPLTSAEYQLASIAFFPQVQKFEDTANFGNMALLLNDALNFIDGFADECSCGENNLICGIAETLQQKLGLVNRQIAKPKE